MNFEHLTMVTFCLVKVGERKIIKFFFEEKFVTKYSIILIHIDIMISKSDKNRLIFINNFKIRLVIKHHFEQKNYTFLLSIYLSRRFYQTLIFLIVLFTNL